MNIHYLQHVPFEGLGSIEPALRKQGHHLTATHLYRGDELPNADTVDLLIVMGGPMGVSDESQYPWLKPEKEFIRRAIGKNKPILGICLGAQLIADALGARVAPNPHREIGWFPIRRHPAIESTCLAGIFPDESTVFHWHGDTFDLPDGAIPLASSQACRNQGFIVDDRIIGLQFHLETTPESAALLLENGREELNGSPFVQTESEILDTQNPFERINRLMARVLRALGA